MPHEPAPAFQFYPKDFLSDSHVVAMTMTERGVYITLLCLCWMEGSVPVSAATLARLCGLSMPTFERLWPALEPCFTNVDGRWVQPRIERERRKQATYRTMKSEAGKQGGRPKADGKQKLIRGQTHGKQQLTRSQANESPPSSSPIFVSDLQSPKEEREKKERVSLSAVADPFLQEEITERAGAFVRTYEALYPECLHGARYAVKPARDYASAVTLCTTWRDDARLLKLARIFLTTDHQFAAEGSRTITQFLALASWCDARLAAVETGHV